MTRIRNNRVTIAGRMGTLLLTALAGCAWVRADDSRIPPLDETQTIRMPAIKAAIDDIDRSDEEAAARGRRQKDLALAGSVAAIGAIFLGVKAISEYSKDVESAEEAPAGPRSECRANSGYGWILVEAKAESRKIRCYDPKRADGADFHTIRLDDGWQSSGLHVGQGEDTYEEAAELACCPLF